MNTSTSTTEMSHQMVHLPCPHESQGIDHETLVPNYHPLSRREIRNLLQNAHQTGDFAVRHSIQIRLSQGIQGYTCPLPSDNPIADKEAAIADLLLASYKQAPTSSLVKAMYNIMNS